MALVLKILYKMNPTVAAAAAADGGEDMKYNFTKIGSSEDMKQRNEALQDSLERENFVSSYIFLFSYKF